MVIYMIILRIQNADGTGPYFCRRDTKAQDVCDIQDKHNGEWREDPTTYPPPNIDKGICREMRKNEQCGFLNMAQLCNWFSDYELEILAIWGFFIVEIPGKITAIGARQVLFIREI